MFDAAIAAAAASAPQVQQVAPLLPGLVVHIDGDYLAYNAAGNDECTPGQARQNALSYIETFRGRVGAEGVVMHNTARGCHKGERFLIATVKPYQAQRADGRKPKNHGYLQDWLQSYEGPAFKVKNWLTREADDGMGACSHFAIGKPPGYAAIATADKDMRMLPGIHINWRQPTICTRVMPGDYDVRGEDGKQYGLKWFWLQMLMGDTADNCPGLPRYAESPGKFKPIGEKTAEKLLADCDTSDQACRRVMRLYALSYATPAEGYDRFCEQAALMWMRLDNTATVTDFATHAGHSRINRPFTQDMWDAVQRLEDRVRLARAEINALAD